MKKKFLGLTLELPILRGQDNARGSTYFYGEQNLVSRKSSHSSHELSMHDLSQIVAVRN